MLQYKILSILFFTVGTLAVFYSKKLALMSLEKTDRQFNRPFDEDEILLNIFMFVRRDKAQVPSGCKSHPAKFDRSSRKPSERRWR
jgi:hypothetical protein